MLQMKKKLFLLFMLLPPSAYAQSALPIIRSNSESVRIISRDSRFQLNPVTDWRLDINENPDIFEVPLIDGKPERVVYRTDIEELAFVVEEGKSYDFIIRRQERDYLQRIVGVAYSDDDRDLILLLDSNSKLWHMVKKIDGSRGLANPALLKTKGLSYCVVYGPGRLLNPEFLSVAAKKAVEGEWLEELAGVSGITGKENDWRECWEQTVLVYDDWVGKQKKPEAGKDYFLWPKHPWAGGLPDAIVVQRGHYKMLDAETKARYRPANEIGGPYSVYPFISNRISAERFDDAIQRREAQRRALIAKLEEMAAADNREAVVALRLPEIKKSPSERLCATTQHKESATAIAAFGERFDSFKQRRCKTCNPYEGIYGNLDELYAEFQRQVADRLQDGRQCTVFVGVPKDVNALFRALIRDFGDPALEANKRCYESGYMSGTNEMNACVLEQRESILSARGARTTNAGTLSRVTSEDLSRGLWLPSPGNYVKALHDEWARNRGFVDWATSQYAVAVGARPEEIKELIDRGVVDKDAFNRVVIEMKSVSYDSQGGVAQVLAYISDKKSAGSGQAAANVKRDRERKELVATLQRRAEYAAEYPFTAILSCSLNSNNFPIEACFSDEISNTELELTNGDHYRMYQYFELSQAGRRSDDSLTIPLRRNFVIKAQNADENFLLTLRITDNTTQKVVFEKSVPRFGVIRFPN